MKKVSSIILILSICLNFIFANVQDENFNDEIISEQQIEYIDINTVSGINSKVSFQQLKQDIVDLKYLLDNENIALSREKLISDVWGYDFFGDDRTLDTHIKLLRKNLGSYSGLIVTLRGVGYRFEAE